MREISVANKSLGVGEDNAVQPVPVKGAINIAPKFWRVILNVEPQETRVKTAIKVGQTIINYPFAT